MSVVTESDANSVGPFPIFLKGNSHARPSTTNQAKRAKKGSDKYSGVSWTSAEPPQPMRRHL